MKRNNLSIALITTLACANAAAGTVQSLVLDEFTVRAIPVNLTSATTFSFPGPIQAISGAGFTPDGREPALFQLDYQPGSFFFAVRPLLPGASASLNVIWNRRTYVFELTETNGPPVLSVLLEAPPPAPLSGRTAPRTVTPTRLLGLLQRAKAYPLLAQHHPAAVRGVTLIRPNRAFDYGDFLLHIVEIYRFEAEDAFVFQVRLENKTNSVVRYLPGSFAVRVGQRPFPQAISDASGAIPPQAPQPAWFAIAGAPDGSRLDLSLKNDFVILVTQQAQP